MCAPSLPLPRDPRDQPVGAGLWLCLHSGVHARWEGKSILGGLWVSLPRCGRFRVFDSPGTLTGRQELGGCGWVTDGCAGESTLLHVAAACKELEAMSTLVELGADKDAHDDEGRTPLHWAASKGYAEAVSTLVNLGADKKAQNADGETPFEISIRLGHREVEQLLNEIKPTKKAASKEPTQQAVDEAERMATEMIEEEEREEAAKAAKAAAPAQKKVRAL